MLVTSVADQGPGIDSIDQNMIFDSFTAGAASASRAGHRHGPRIAKAIVEAHGGTISLTTQPGRGSVFSFTLRWLGNGAPGRHASVQYSRF